MIGKQQKMFQRINEAEGGKPKRAFHCIRMTDFRARYPEIGIRIMYAIHGQQLDFNEIDVALIYSNKPITISDVTLTKLLAGDSAPVCSQSFLELHGSLAKPASIVKAGLIHDTDTSGWRRWFESATGASSTPPDGPTYEDFSLLRAATLAGQGVSLCPVAIIEDDLEAGRLVQLSSITVLEETGYYLARQALRHSRTRPEIDIFHNWLFENSSDFPG
jgi:LysR family transcriptional regulator, glycine cleavage system transcriptional activator